MNNLIFKFNTKFFVLSFLYWYILSFFDRTVFLICNYAKFDDLKDVFYAYIYGFRLDASLACYILIVPFLVYSFQHFFLNRQISPWLLRIYTFVPTFVFGLITIVNLPLYEAWGEKISKRAILLGAGTVGGVSSSIDFGMLFQAFIVLICYFLVAHYSYHLLVVKFAKYKKQHISDSVLYFIIGAFVIFSFTRGSYSRTAINTSTVYFSDNNVSNHLAVNTYWCFIKDMFKSSKKNPYQFMDNHDAQNIVNKIKDQSNLKYVNPLNTKTPNVVLIILEGMVAQIFEDLGGEKNVAPNLNRLMREGVNFKNAFAAADRSDKGMIAVMSGFPAQGTESIIQYISKHEKLPGIGQIYDSLGYSTSFYHGGQSEFYNFKSFMFTHGIERVVDNLNFGIHEDRNSWGVYDHVVANKMLEDLRHEKKPFFTVFYTMVNHEPYHLKDEYHFGNKTKANAYRSTAFYTDTMLNSFVEKAKKEDWYANTVFVVVSDHGNIYPTEKYGLEHPNRYHIPLFLFGGALKSEFKGKIVEDVVSQLDVVNTLWYFVSDKKSPFKYSNNLFSSPLKGTAFINSNNTFGILKNKQMVTYDMQGKRIAFVKDKNASKNNIDTLLKQAEAYYQIVFQDFLKY